MGAFGWVHVSGAVDCAQGPHAAIQFASGTAGNFGRPLSGSSNLTYYDDPAGGADRPTPALILTGSMFISGTIKANAFDVITTTQTEIDIAGSTNFGNDETDSHHFTGSIVIVSGSFSQHYYKLVGASHTVTAYDSIIGVSSSAYVSITLPSAADASFGKMLIIKDEWDATRSSANRIAISASGGQTIDHSTTYSLTGDSPALSIYSDGATKWFIY
jgi:hypothetical protein